MERWSARSAILCAVACIALLAFGAGAASAFEGTAGGWYWQNPLVQGNSLHDVAVTSGRTVAVGDAGVVFTSTDGGGSWERGRSGMRGSLRSVALVDASTGWAVGDGGMIATTDGGRNWKAQDLPGAGTYKFTSVSFVNANDGWACGSYTVRGGTSSSRIVRTVNGGATWTIAKEWTNGSSKADVQFLRQVSFVSATTGWATGWGYDAVAGDWGYAVLETTDGGSNWTISRFGDGKAAITAIEFTSASDGWLATASLATYAPARIWATSDGGATWVEKAARDGATISDLAASGGECYAAGQLQGVSDWSGFILHTADGGVNWSQEYTEDTAKPEAVGFNSSTAIAVGAGALILRRNAANGTWTEFAPGLRKNLTNVQFRSATLGWAVGWKSTILRTTNGGRTWITTSVPRGISLEGIDMVTNKVGWAVGCSGPHVPYADLSAGYGAVVLRTTDGGKHWAFKLNRTTKPGLAGVDFTDAKHGVAVGTSGLVARTTNGGKTWWYRTVGSSTLRDVAFTDASSGVAVGGDTGTRSANGVIWSTTDGGVTWKAATTDTAPVAPLRAIQRQESASAGVSFTIVGDDGQMYTAGSDVASWQFNDLTPIIVTQEPPYYHFMDIGLCTIADPSLVAADDADAWALGEAGAIWTRNGGRWQLPPTISGFVPASGAPGTTVTVYGSGFQPWKPGDTGPIGWVQITDPGSGYTTAPTVTIDDPRVGITATATATIDAAGTVTAITIVEGGSGYSTGSSYSVTIGQSPSHPVGDATAIAIPAARTAVTFAGGGAAVPIAVTDTQMTVLVPDGAETGKLSVTTWRGEGNSLERFEVPGTTPAVQTHLLNHSGGSGQDNQLNGIAVVDWLNAWAVGDHGTILSFDRMPPETSVAPSNGWVRTPQVSLSSSDSKSGLAWVRWIVDPPDINGDTNPPIGDWDSWAWQYGTTATWELTAGSDAPGTQHVIYYQALDNTGNIELDPFWVKQTPNDPEFEVPKHMWVTLDRVGPQTYAPVAASVKRNKYPALTFWVNDDLSSKADVTIVVKDSGGKTVKTLKMGWLATWQQFSSPIADWKCTLPKGSYTFRVLAKDQAGNDQVDPAGSSTLTVY
jgi:photosystem II stability/assembly factor-like uncharacterized protein